MLVKIISFVITVFGTKRYKQPLLFSSLAVAISLIGITTFVSLYDTAPHSAASTAGQSEEASGQPSSGLSKQGLKKQTPANPEVASTPTTTDGSTPATTPETTNATASSGTTAPTIVLKETTLSLKKGSESSPLSLSLSDNSKVQWSVSLNSTAPGLTLGTAPDSAATATTSVTFKADSSLTSGQYTVIIHAKDAGRGIDLQKEISISITAPAE